MRFEMGGGGPPDPPKWPRGVSDEIGKSMSWLKGTEWQWNNDQWTLKLERDGDIDAPVRQCRRGQCKWTAQKGKIYLAIGEAGIFQLDAQEQKPENMGGTRFRGRSLQDGQRLTITFQRIFDHEAADLDKDLYEILGLPDDADDAAIKKVYRKLSVKYHPDKNPDEDSKVKFAEIRDAYEVLNDPDKKLLYDTGGMEAVKKGEKGDIEKTDDMKSTIKVKLDDLYQGSEMKAQINRRIVCRGCRAKPNAPSCRGCGRCPNEVRVVNVQMGPFMTQQQQEVPSKEKCKMADAQIDVHVERGMREGETITFPRMAEERPGMLPGSVVLTLQVEKHPKFVRKGNDLHLDVKVSLREALLGWSRTVRHIDGHSVELSTDSVTRHLQTIVVKGEGMPLRDDPSTFGDLRAKVHVQFPPGSLSKEQREGIERLFPVDPPRTEL